MEVDVSVGLKNLRAERVVRCDDLARAVDFLQ